MNTKVVLVLLASVLWGCSGDSSSEIRSHSQKTRVSSEKWIKVQEQNFSFSIPKSLKKEDVTPFDSVFIRYSSKTMTLVAEVGVNAPSISYYKEDPNDIAFEQEKVELKNKIGYQANFQFASGKSNYQDRNKEFGKVVEVRCQDENDMVTFLILFSDRKYDGTARQIINSVSVDCPRRVF